MNVYWCWSLNEATPGLIVSKLEMTLNTMSQLLILHIGLRLLVDGGHSLC